MADTTPTSIAGNVSDEAKDTADYHFHQYMSNDSFGSSVGQRMRITDIDAKLGADGKRNWTMVFEVTVEKDMCNGGLTMHGGCSAWLVDVCTSSTFCLDEKWRDRHVSTALNVIYHSPAPIGTRLRIVATTVTLGGRVGNSRCEIWDKDKHSLVSSGTHMKMVATQKSRL